MNSRALAILLAVILLPTGTGMAEAKDPEFRGSFKGKASLQTKTDIFPGFSKVTARSSSSGASVDFKIAAVLIFGSDTGPLDGFINVRGKTMHMSDAFFHLDGTNLGPITIPCRRSKGTISASGSRVASGLPIKVSCKIRTTQTRHRQKLFIVYTATTPSNTYTFRFTTSRKLKIK
ncbi:MAG: hypothetical protein ACREKL_02055 [Chthoniobacterales bacterium]